MACYPSGVVLGAVVLAGCSSGTGNDMLTARAYFDAQAYDVPRTYDPQGIIGGPYPMCEPYRPREHFLWPYNLPFKSCPSGRGRPP